MGGAKVISKDISNNLLTVSLEYESDKLQELSSSLTASVASLNARISSLEGEVVIAQANATAAQVALNTAINTNQPTETIIQLTGELGLAVSALSEANRNLTIAKYQLASTSKQLINVTNTITEWDRADIAITLTDPGRSIQIGDTIGIAEYARVSNAGSFFVALPSERDGFDNTYSAARDGIAIPKLGETPYGWWYNEMVIPSAQIWRPRYWVGILMNKDDDENTGTVFIQASEDFGTKPYKPYKSMWDVTFEYDNIAPREVNSKAFVIGDLVLVEFSDEGISQTPVVIGFGTTERFDAQFHDRYLRINKDEFGGFAYELEAISSGQISGQNEEVVSVNGTRTQQEADEAAAKFAASLGLGDLQFFSSSEPLQNIFYFGSFYEEVINTSDHNPSLLIFPLVTNGRPLTTLYRSIYRYNEFVTVALSNITFDEPHFVNGYAALNDWQVAATDPDSTVELFTSGSLTISAQSEGMRNAKNLPLYDKVRGLGVIDQQWRGVVAKATYFWQAGSYVDPVLDTQLVEITQNTNQVFSFHQRELFSQMTLYVSHGSPSDDFAGSTVATGTQNYFAYSELLLNPDRSSGGVNIIDENNTDPEGTEDSAGIIVRSSDLKGIAYYIMRTSSIVTLPASYCVTVFVRRFPLCRAVIGSGGGPAASLEVDLVKGEALVVGVGIQEYSITEVDGDYWRISIGRTSSTLPLLLVQFLQLDDLTTDYSTTTREMQGIGCNIWGMQINDGLTYTGYKKTTGTAAP